MYQKLSSIECDNRNAARVHGLPADWYTDPVFFEREKKQIFYRSWICVGHVCMAASPGDYFVGSIADQEVLVVRDQDGELNAFFNVCQHRGHRLASDSGSCERFTCPYHAWSYGLDGQLLKAPHSELVPGFDTGKVRLAPVRLETLAGAVFVNLDVQAPGLHEVFPGTETEILTVKPDVAEQQLVYEYPMAHHCNWESIGGELL